MITSEPNAYPFSPSSCTHFFAELCFFKIPLSSFISNVGLYEFRDTGRLFQLPIVSLELVEWGVPLFVLDNADLGGTKNSAVELEALLLHVEDGVVLLVGLGRHEGGLVLVGVELVTVGLEALEAVLVEGLDEDGLRHLDALVQVDEVLVIAGQLLGGDGGQGAVEVVHAIDEVLGELLDRKVASALDLALGAVLEVAEVGDGAKTFILNE